MLQHQGLWDMKALERLADTSCPLGYRCASARFNAGAGQTDAMGQPSPGVHPASPSQPTGCDGLTLRQHKGDEMVSQDKCWDCPNFVSVSALPCSLPLNPSLNPSAIPSLASLVKCFASLAINARAREATP